MRWTFPIAYMYFIQSKWSIQLTIFIVSSSLSEKKVKNSPVQTIKCETLHLRFSRGKQYYLETNSSFTFQK